MKTFFPISQPSIGQREVEYVTKAVQSGWVSSIGEYIEAFEKSFATFCGTQYALAVSSGTSGLHLALVSLGIKANDEVIIPDLTFVATANAVAYTGARVVPVDIDRETLCIDTTAVEAAVTPRTRAILPVHLYGQPAAMDSLRAIAHEKKLFLIEDAAEAHGAEYKGRRVGAIGDCGVFSFYGNKIVTTGEGGMITTNSRDFYDRAKLLRDHAMSPTQRYWHTQVGFNYRMTNLQAALGVAQMERIDEFLEKRQKIMAWYRDALGLGSRLRLNHQAPGTRNVYWMVCLEIHGMEATMRDRLMGRLRELGVDSRPYFHPVSDLPMYDRANTPVAHEASRCGLNLPSYSDLSESDVGQICEITSGVLSQLKI